jgi:hypothetical protein
MTAVDPHEALLRSIREGLDAAGRGRAMAALLQAADALVDGATGNGHSVFVGKASLDRLINAIAEVKAHGRS